MPVLPLDADIAALPPRPTWGTPARAIYDALVGCIEFEKAHGLERGSLIDAICTPMIFDDAGNGKPPVMV